MALVVNRHQLCGMLRKASGYGGAVASDIDPVDFLTELCDQGNLRLPFEPEGVFWIPNRLPIFSEVQKSLTRSLLLSQLITRSEDTGLVVDSLRQGGDAIYFARLYSDMAMDNVVEWVERANPQTASVTIKSIDEHILVLATLKSFVATPEVA